MTFYRSFSILLHGHLLSLVFQIESCLYSILHFGYWFVVAMEFFHHCKRCEYPNFVNKFNLEVSRWDPFSITYIYRLMCINRQCSLLYYSIYTSHQYKHHTIFRQLSNLHSFLHQK